MKSVSLIYGVNRQLHVLITYRNPRPIRVSLRPETGDESPKTGDGSPESGDRRPESGVRRPETGDGDRRPETEDRRPKSGVRRRETEVRSPESGVQGSQSCFLLIVNSLRTLRIHGELCGE